MNTLTSTWPGSQGYHDPPEQLQRGQCWLVGLRGCPEVSGVFCFVFSKRQLFSSSGEIPVEKIRRVPNMWELELKPLCWLGDKNPFEEVFDKVKLMNGAIVVSFPDPFPPFSLLPHGLQSPTFSQFLGSIPP
jgi:hypothetical protein